MSTLVRKIGRIRGRRSARHAGPTVREVCLLGPARPALPWAPGAEVEVGGRFYRVAAAGPAAAGDDGSPRYVHLAPRAADGG